MEEIIKTPIEEEVKQAYIDYSMSVIVSRALPDARDGLKPVHRRILHAMNELSLRANGPTRKCAKIVGDVLGKYHPHGDASVYDALVRLGQDFAERYPLITPQGNFGTIAGDPPAAYRYTEAKMARLAEEMTADLEKETVDMVANFDETTTEPTVLPAKFPFLLCNGAMGIAVGMATNMASHNLREVGAAVAAYIDAIKTPEVKGEVESTITTERLMKYIKGPDFPTGGVIHGTEGVRRAYSTGRGRVVIRAKYITQEDKRGKTSIVFTEVPYAVNTTTIIKKIKELGRTRVLDGITDVNDESSDRAGLRLVVGVRRGANLKVILNNLFLKTDLQASFNINNLALVDGRPVTLTLKGLIKCFVKHRDEVITRRTEFDLRRAHEREHILKALIIALDNIDEVIKIIRSSEDTDAAKRGLEERFGFDEAQSQAIVDMQLKRLTHLQIEDLKRELEELEALIAHLEDLLAHHKKILGVIKSEMRELVEKYGDDRRTEIIEDAGALDIDKSELVKDEGALVLLTRFGYLKRVALDTYQKQARGGVGVNSMALIEGDYITGVWTGSTRANILFVTTAGKVYNIKVFEIPPASKNTRGVNIKTLLSMTDGEEVTATVMIGGGEKSESVLATLPVIDNPAILMVTKFGVVKKVAAGEFSRAGARGVRGILLKGRTSGTKADEGANPLGGGSFSNEGSGDTLISAIIVSGGSSSDLEKGINEENISLSQDRDDPVTDEIVAQSANDVLIVTRLGKALRCNLGAIRVMGRSSSGVRGIKLSKGDYVAGSAAVSSDKTVLIITEKGYGKRVRFSDFEAHGRGTGGQKIFGRTDLRGEIVSIMAVREDDEVLCITKTGKTLRAKVASIGIGSRTSSGVKVVRLQEGDLLTGGAVAEVTPDKVDGQSESN